MMANATINDSKVVGEVLSTARNRKKISQSAFAELLGIARNTYINYENGIRDIPASVLAQACIELDITADQVLFAPEFLPELREKSGEYAKLAEIGIIVDELTNEMEIPRSNQEKWQFIIDTFKGYLTNRTFNKTSFTTNFKFFKGAPK